MKNNKAFTLVELIIVIAVIGVLAAILIPIFSNVIDKANAKSALSDAKNSMEQVIIEAAENDAMPENILIIVRKAKNFYVYGFNRMTDGCLYQSPGNPFSGFSDVQALIDARSWNALQGDTAPDLDTAYTDYDTYGYFYLVPYSGGTSLAPTVRAFRAVNEYPEISDLSNGLMTENMGNDVHIYHGVLTDKININEQAEGNGSATPSATPASSSTPDTDYILITEASQLSDTFFNAHGLDKKYRLANDITLSGMFTMIEGVFSGELDGNGKTISGLYINSIDSVKVGLFREVRGANLHDFTLSVKNILGESNVGTVCGVATDTSFTNIHVEIQGKVVACCDGDHLAMIEYPYYQNSLGGLCAVGISISAYRCSVKGILSGHEMGDAISAGLFCGCSGTVSECFFSGRLNLNCWVGGIAGGLLRQDFEQNTSINTPVYNLNLSVENCYANFSCEDVQYVGGILCGNEFDNSMVRVKNCAAVCPEILYGSRYNCENSGAVVVNLNTLTDCIENCYGLIGQWHYEHTTNGGTNYNGTLVSAFTAENCPALDTEVWSFSGSYPTIINNPE